MGVQWVGRWAGGRVSKRRDGRLRWHIERQVGHERYRIALDVRDPDSALAQLALFDLDPAGYAGRYAPEPVEGVGVDADRVEAFDGYLKGQGRTLRYRRNVAVYLNQWIEALGARPLGKVRLADLHAALDAAGTARKHRIIALKSFCAWLRETGQIERSADPTLDLKVPPPRPEKAVREKGYSMEHVAAIYRAVDEQDVRDVLCIRAKTGMHETEIGRVVRGDCIVREAPDACGIAAVIRFVHKSGRVHVQSIDAQALAAVRRLQERWAAIPAADRPEDAIDNARLRRCIGVAAQRAGVEAIKPGELRHSFVTWREHARLVAPVAGGVDLARIAEIIGHQSVRTTRTYYDNLSMPPMIVLPLVLAHPHDPPLTPPESEPAERRKSSRRGAPASSVRGEETRPPTPKAPSRRRRA
jgi:integrase